MGYSRGGVLMECRQLLNIQPGSRGGESLGCRFPNHVYLELYPDGYRKDSKGLDDYYIAGLFVDIGGRQVIFDPIMLGDFFRFFSDHRVQRLTERIHSRSNVQDYHRRVTGLTAMVTAFSSLNRADLDFTMDVLSEDESDEV